jgi:hypothetical protein
MDALCANTVKGKVIMQSVQTLAQAKKFARSLEKALKAQGITLSHGKALDVQAQMSGHQDWNALCAVLGASGKDKTANAPQFVSPLVARAPLITDIDFFEAHCVIFGGKCFNIEWREEKALPYLCKQDDEDWEDWEDETALELHYEDDGLVFTETLTVGLLSSLHWDTSKGLFVDPEGETYKFFVSRPFGVAAPLKAVSLPVLPSAKAKAAKYKLYCFYKGLLDEKDTYVVALSKEDAEAERTAKVGAGAVTIAHELDPDDFGPYIVEVNFGFYDEFESLSKAIKVARGLLSADDNLDSANVLMPSGDCLITFNA